MTNHSRYAIALLGLLMTTIAVAGQSAPGTGPAQVSRAGAAFRADRIERIDRWLRQYVDDKRVAGAVVLVLRDGKPVYERAVGWSDREAGRPMTTDTIFRVASHTKAITSVAVLSLIEEGKIDIDDQVSRFIPAYARTTVAIRKEKGAAVIPADRQLRSGIC